MESLFCPVHLISSPLCWPDIRWTDDESVFNPHNKYNYHLHISAYVSDKLFSYLWCFHSENIEKTVAAVILVYAPVSAVLLANFRRTIGFATHPFRPFAFF